MCPLVILICAMQLRYLIRNYPYGQKDIRNSRKIFGLSVPGHKGMTVKRKSKLPSEDKPVENLPLIAKI